MKHLIIILGAILINLVGMAQQQDQVNDLDETKEYRIKMVKEVDGSTTEIDTSFSTPEELEAYAQSLHSEIISLKKELILVHIAGGDENSNNGSDSDVMIERFNIDLQSEGDEEEVRIIVQTSDDDPAFDELRMKKCSGKKMMMKECKGDKMMKRNIVCERNLKSGEMEVICDGDTIIIVCKGDIMGVKPNGKKCAIVRKIVINDATIEECNSIGLTDHESELDLTNLQAYPNPANGDLNINFNASEGSAEVVIRDVLGEVVERKNIYSESGEFFTIFDISDIMAGNYFVTMSQGDKSLTKKVVIQ